MPTFFSRSRSLAPLSLHPVFALLALLLAFAGWGNIRVGAIPAAALPALAPPSQRFGQLPLSFVPNTGQADPQVRFQTSGLGGSLFFTSNEVLLALPRPAEPSSAPAPGRHPGAAAPQATARAPQVVRLSFQGANPTPRIQGGQIQPGKINYFQGDDPARWRTQIATYDSITYAALYPGVDLRYDGADGRLKGTYTVAPGADPARIRWRYTGAAGAQVDAPTGDLRIALEGASTPLIERAPVAWQEIDGRRVPVAAHYLIGRDGAVGFALGRYDTTRALTIDPTLEYGTFLGGSGADAAYDMVLDAAGNIYVAGSTTSGDFPPNRPPNSASGSEDVFVTKLSPDGATLLFSSYLAGNDADRAEGIAVDSAGTIFLTGRTESADFPTINAVQPTSSGSSCGYPPCYDGFVARLAASGGQLDFSTYLRGEAADISFAIAVDNQSDVYVTGITQSDNFPSQHPQQPSPRDSVFVTKLRGDGSALLWTTFLNSGEGYGIVVDRAHNVYVTGLAHTAAFPTSKPIQACHASYGDIFVTKLTPDGSTMPFSTCLGGNDNEYGQGIALDGAGNIYVAGATSSYDFPVTKPLDRSLGGYIDAVVAKLSADGQSLLYSTYLGGANMDFAFGIAADSAGNAYVTGYTDSPDFPVASPIQASRGPNTRCGAFFCESFVAKLNKTGSALLFSSFLGGEGNDIGYAIAVDSQGTIVVAGSTDSPDFPTKRPLQPNLLGNDAFVAKISIPTTTLIDTLIDDTTGLPISNHSGTLLLYAGTGFLDSVSFTTDAQGRYSANFTGPISQSVRLEYSAISGYAHQYYDRRATLGQSDPLALHSGVNFLSSRLIPATVLTNTLIDDTSGLPIASSSGTIFVYADTALVETKPFTTDANGVATIAFDTIINYSVRLGYRVDGYVDQYFDRKLTQSQSIPVELHSGANLLTNRLIRSTRLINTLLDNTTSQPISTTNGQVDVFSGTLLLESQPFTTSASGTYTATFHSPINQDVRLGYRISNYGQQYYDRKASLSQADPIKLLGGVNTLTSHLIPATRLTNTLLDDATGLPISSMGGWINVYSGTMLLESQPFTTNASGIYTTTFQHLIDQNVALEYLAGSYAWQFYDHKSVLGQATLVAIHSGGNTLTTRLAARTTLVNTLLDHATGQPIANAKGTVTTYVGGAPAETQYFTADASGVYTTTFNRLLDQPTWLEYGRVNGYARQFYSRAFSSDQAAAIPLHVGQNRLTTRLLAAPTFSNTLLDDSTGLPIKNASGSLALFLGSQYLESVPFMTNASGVYSTTLSNTPIGARVTLGYSPMNGYATQYYDRKVRPDQADGVLIGAGQNQLTTRLIPATTLVNTLLNGATGQPLQHVFGSIDVISGTTRLELLSFNTDASGVYTATLSGIVNQDVQLRYRVNGYPQQYYDGKLSAGQAARIRLASGINRLTTHLLSTTLSNTLVNDATGQPIRTTAGAIEVYSGTVMLERQPFQTDSSGVFTTTFATLLDQQVVLGYQVSGYPAQFADRKLVLAQADPIQLASGLNRLTTRLLATMLINTLIDDSTGQPIANVAGSIDVYSGTILLEQQPFRTDTSGVYTATLQHLIGQDVRLAHTISGYPKQFYDRRLTLTEADPVQLRPGLTKLTTHLLPATLLTNILLDDMTGQPLRTVYGQVTVYAGVTPIMIAQLGTDSSGAFTLTFPEIVSQSVRIEYRFTDYAFQYADRKATFDKADLIPLRSGTTSLTTRLLRMPEITNRLVDDATGQPLANRTGYLTVSWAGGWQESAAFTTDATGTFTAQFEPSNLTYRPVPVGEPVLLAYQLDGYLDQYYDHATAPSQATPVILQSGLNTLTTRLVPETALVTTLLDNDTGEPLRNTNIRMALGDVPLDAANGISYTTDAEGRFTQRLGALVGQGQRIAISTDGYPAQYYDRTSSFDLAKTFELHPGLNTLTVRLAHVPRLATTLLDNTTGEPIRNMTGTVWIYGIPDWPAGAYWFNTDDQGVFKLDLDGLLILGVDVRLRYEVSGYPRQFYDQAATYDQGIPLLLGAGTNDVTVRLARDLTPPATPTPTPLPSVPGLIRPDTGGSLRYSDTTTITLSFPPSAVTEPISVTVAAQRAEHTASGMQALGPAFDVAGHNLAGTAISQLAQPLTIEMQYDPRDSEGIDERSLYIAYWDAAAGSWLALPTQRDPQAHTISAVVDRLGQFALFGRPSWKVYLPLASR